MALVLGVLVAMVSVPAFAVVVNFPDPGLEAAIRDAIEKATGDIHDTDLTGITSLNAANRGIVNLDGIQYCTDLTELYLNNNQIVDISALSGLTNLRWLYLGRNQIVDISALSRLTNLTSLFLRSNQIVDISALSGLTNLTHLWLSDNRIIDISALSGLTKLTRLWLNGNEIVNIQVLVDNTGLGAGDWVNIRYNYLDLTPGSPDKLDIGTLEGRLVAVAYIPQKD